MTLFMLMYVALLSTVATNPAELFYGIFNVSTG